jgi:hypothetical protein
MVPIITAIITTANKKTEIFALLAFKAKTRLFDAPKNLTSFKILKTLNKRKALKATKACVPAKIIDKYLGMVESKSIIP